MSGPADRRGHARFITILPLSILDAGGGVIDSTATAHDLVPGGFKCECQADMQEGQTFHFALELPDGKSARGQAVAVWVKKNDFATWVGSRITRMTWADKRRLKAVISPPGVDWRPLLDQAFNALMWITILMAAQRIMFERPMWRRTLIELLPSLAALTVMGWALLALIRRR